MAARAWRGQTSALAIGMVWALEIGAIGGIAGGAAGCGGDARRGAAPAASVDPIARTGIDGCNCAGAAPVMTAPDGVAYPFQSVVSYYYRELELYRARVGGAEVLETWVPPLLDTDEAFYSWQAKSVQIYADRDALGYAHRYYRGTFGFGEVSGAGESEGAVCESVLDDDARRRGMLAHVGLSQAGACGENDDGTTKFWQVNGLSLLELGDVFDAGELVAAGLAAWVDAAPASRCILAASPMPLPLPLPEPDPGQPDPVIACRAAFRADAVTEAVVLPVPTGAAVAGVPLGHRAFTAAGTAPLPNGLDGVRKILRDGQLRAMYAIGRPRFVAEPGLGPTKVRLVAQRVGPAAQPSPVLLPEERAWVDGVAGSYEAACCRVECDADAGAGSALAAFVVGERSGSESGSGWGSGSGSDSGGGEDAGVDAAIDAGLDGGMDGGIDGGIDGGVAVDAGWPWDGGGGGGSGTDGGIIDAGWPWDGGGGGGSGSGGGLDGGIIDAGSGGGSGSGSGGGSGELPPGCRAVCRAEGVCETSAVTVGLLVMASNATSAECAGSCPEAASGADVPQAAPACAP